MIQGDQDNRSVTITEMMYHTRLVCKGVRLSYVVADMPFGSYQESPKIAFRNASKVMKEVGCDGIKLEGGIEMAETISFLTERGIPVLAHVGLLPQSINTTGGFHSQGKNDQEADRYHRK